MSHTDLQVEFLGYTKRLFFALGICYQGDSAGTDYSASCSLHKIHKYLNENHALFHLFIKCWYLGYVANSIWIWTSQKKLQQINRTLCVVF